MAWRFQVAHEWPALGFSMIATDADETMIERAEAACYARSSLKDLPQEWLDRAFIRRSKLFCLAPEFRQGVELMLQDIRRSMPEGPFDLILCRNLVFTYFTATRCSAVSRTSCRNGCGRVAFSSWEATKLCRPMPAAGCALLQNWGSIGGRHDAVI